MRIFRFVPALLALSAPVFATTLLAVDLPDLSRSADAVVQGTVKSQRSRWTADGARIVTDVEIAVAETLKGATPATVVVMQLGGEVDEVGQRVEGVGTFSVGDEVVVFLERVGTQRYQLVGMAQGKFRVERSSDGRAAFVSQDRASQGLLLDAVTRQPRSPTSQVLTLEALKATVRAALVGQPASPGRGPAKVSPPLKETK